MNFYNPVQKIKYNVLDLQKALTEKRQKRNEAFEKVMEICYRRIKAATDIEKVRTFVVVPEFVIGYPIYNMNECLEYVINSLKKNGFLIRYYFPKMLYVSWDLDEIDTEKKPPPTIQIQKPKALLTSNITTNRNGKLTLTL